MLFGYICSTSGPLLLLRDTALRVQILDMAALSACCRIDDAVDQCRFARRQGFGKGLGETFRVGDMMTSAPESLNEVVVARVFIKGGRRRISTSAAVDIVPAIDAAIVEHNRDDRQRIAAK